MISDRIEEALEVADLCKAEGIHGLPQDALVVLADAVQEAQERLRLIAVNAEAWHGDDAAKGRALAVIAGWARGEPLPAGLAVSPPADEAK